MPKSNSIQTRFSNIVSLKDAIQSLFKEYKIDGKFKQARVIGEWEKITGKLIAKETKHIYFNKKKLFLQIASPALKHELIYNKQKLISLINQYSEMELITDVVFI